jgi:hypothetical protein
MLTAGKWVSSVLAGGIALGAIMGAAADPTIKDPPPQWWQLAGTDTSISPSNQVFAEVGPYDLDVHSGYRPDLDYDAEVWALPLPDLDFAYYEYKEPPPPAADVSPPAAEVETAADQAVEAVGEATQVAQAEPATVEVRQSELAANGIY